MPEFPIPFLLPTIIGVASAAQAQSLERHYVCAFGVEFSVRFRAGHATVLAHGRRYELVSRPLSVGVRYGSDKVAFAQDEDRAVLIGAAGGPYRDCIERPASPLA